MAKPLLAKLAWKDGGGAWAWRVPPALAAELAPLSGAPAGAASFRIAFVRDRAELAEAARDVAAGYAPGGHLWLCYPKQSGSIRTDLSRDRGWEPILALGLLPVTQVALDDDWSALRFRFRQEIAKLTRRGLQASSRA